VRKGLIVVKACKGTQQDVGSIPTASTNQTDRNTMVELSEFAAVKTENAVVYHASNLDVLPLMADNSVDSIVCDPPYELGFMGKSWDSTGIAYSVELWRECLRVLKPGGHILAFGGSRTWHRVAVAIEDAGFELRDSIAWLYGSGFPKSLDVSKAIDKSSGQNKERQLKFVEWMRSTGISPKQINDATETQMSSHYLGLSQPAIATADLFDKLRPYLPEVPEEIERLVAERTGIEWTAYKNREVIGSKTAGMGSGKTFGMLQAEGNNLAAEKQIDITAPATDEAKQWQGWGTALKPAFEPVVVGRKPLIGTVAANVLEWGVGGLNIDASRIGTNGGTKGADFGEQGDVYGNGLNGNFGKPVAGLGRWPANIILDDFTAGLLDEQSGESKSQIMNFKVKGRSGGILGSEGADRDYVGGHNDSGGASRFFYVAKASKRDRNEGLEELEAKTSSKFDGGSLPDYRGIDNREVKAQNFHPTVKPTDLMRYLIKLVTPAGGVVLDPFTGSGSTGKAALLDGYRFIGIEMTADYLPIIEGRLVWAEAEAQRVAQAAAEEESIRLF